ncbi:MAG: type II toxin-antitoxin system MqsA family antitoxin [Deltaproteobacteria bacterium]|nr:type II toxin-antitoxin system MqsA family antitoxin [Deltaproteobacteria bacterium]
MRCPNCEKELSKTKRDYHYIESGLDKVILKGINVYTCSCGEEMPEIPNIEGLHKTIAMALIHKNTLLTGQGIKFLRKAMDLKAVELAQLMGVDKVTISRWENNKAEISNANDHLLRMIYIRKLEEESNQLLSEPILNILKNITPVTGKLSKINISSKGKGMYFAEPMAA